MRIRDWSSDVCSSVLGLAGLDGAGEDHAVDRRADHGAAKVDAGGFRRSGLLADLRLRGVDLRPRLVARGAGQVDVAFRHQLLRAKLRLAAVIRDRKSVVEGKRVLVRVELGGRRTIKKKTKKQTQNNNNT